MENENQNKTQIRRWLEILRNGGVEGQNATHHTTTYNFTSWKVDLDVRVKFNILIYLTKLICVYFFRPFDFDQTTINISIAWKPNPLTSTTNPSLISKPFKRYLWTKTTHSNLVLYIYTCYILICYISQIVPLTNNA
jgi:hypothetical protein